MHFRQALPAPLAAIALVGLLAPSSQAITIHAVISYGVTDYGAPVPGVPTFIPNNFSGQNDILSSPGGTFLTANPVLANNIASQGFATLPAGSVQVGGGNGNGSFGSGAVSISGPGVGFDLSDPIPGGGSASYEIASWNATYTDPAGYVGSYGSYLSIGGSLPAVGSAAAISLVTEITSNDPASPFFGGITLPDLVLADAQVSPGVYSWVALGGSGAAVVTDAVTSTFEGLAINNLAVAIPAGDVFTVTTTMTAYADPATIDTTAPDLSLLPDLALPGVVLSASTPEPSSTMLALIAAAILAAARFAGRKRNS